MTHDPEHPTTDHTENTISLDVIRRSYGWTLDNDGQVCGLVSGNMGYEDTGIFIPVDHITAWLTADHQKIEDTPAYKAGFIAAREIAAMSHAQAWHEQERLKNNKIAALHRDWAGRMWNIKP